MLIETLRSELPERGIRYSSKVVDIQDSGFFKLVHLVDGTVLKTKVLSGFVAVGIALIDSTIVTY